MPETMEVLSESTEVNAFGVDAIRSESVTPGAKPQIREEIAHAAPDRVMQSNAGIKVAQEATQIADQLGLAGTERKDFFSNYANLAARLSEAQRQQVVADLNKLIAGSLYSGLTVTQENWVMAHRKELITSLIKEAADPTEFNSGIHSTCTVTSATAATLLKDRPEEYVHAVASLLTTGEHSFSASGARIKLPLDSVQEDASTEFGNAYRSNSEAQARHVRGRSLSEQVFQASIMDYANGDETYRDGEGSGTSIKGGKDLGGGLMDSQTARAISAMIGQTFGAFVGSSNEVHQRAHEVAEAALERVRSGQDTTVSVIWTRENFHGINLVKTPAREADDGWVYFTNNPHGKSDLEAGTEVNGIPKYVVVDGQQCLYKMKRTELENCIRCAYMGINERSGVSLDEMPVPTAMDAYRGEIPVTYVVAGEFSAARDNVTPLNDPARQRAIEMQEERRKNVQQSKRLGEETDEDRSEQGGKLANEGGDSLDSGPEAAYRRFRAAFEAATRHAEKEPSA